MGRQLLSNSRETRWNVWQHMHYITWTLDSSVRHLPITCMVFFRLADFSTFAFHSSSFVTEGGSLNRMTAYKRLHSVKHSYFPQTWDKHSKAELRANQRRTKMNLLPFFSTETWGLILLFVVLLLVWVKYFLLILCSCHFSLLAIAHFHTTNLLKSRCDFQFSSI